MIALVRAGVGVGVVNAVALGPFELTGLSVLDVGDPTVRRDVVGYWYDAITTSGVGMELQRAILAASPPPGGHPPEG
jgi:hypothetical protein